MNEEIILKAPAKINLSLDVLNKRDDGYHNVSMVMQQVTLYDDIRVSVTQGKSIKVDTDCEFLPTDSNNITYKAAELMMEKYSLDKGINIFIEKRIPIAAGLAGGSTDAASVIKGINTLFDLNLTMNEMMDIGGQLGADVPFCVQGGCALAEGIGEKLTPIKGMDKGWLVLCKPMVSVSTALAYKGLKLHDIRVKPNNIAMIEALNQSNIYDICDNMINVFEPGIIKQYPVVKAIKDKLIEYGAIGSMMSGSGPTVYGVFKDYNKAHAAYNNLRLLYKQTYLVRPLNRRC